MDLIEDFYSVTEVTVRWGDMDAYQHVNNTLYFRYMETARINYFADAGFGGVGAVGTAPLLHTASCRFRVALVHPDTALVASRIVELGKDRFKMYQRIVSAQNQVIAAEGYSIIVAFDYDANRTGTIPESVYQTIIERDRPVLKDRISLNIAG